MEDIKIYDPRLGQQFSTASGDGPQWFNFDQHCLAVEISPNHPAALNCEFWIKFLTHFKSEMMSLHVDYLGKRSKTRKQLEKTLGKNSLRKKNKYFATFNNSEQLAKEIITIYTKMGISEEWIIGGFNSNYTSKVENIEFVYCGERDDFFRDILLFDFILSFNLDWHDARVVCSREEWFDDIITLFMNRFPPRTGAPPLGVG